MWSFAAKRDDIYVTILSIYKKLLDTLPLQVNFQKFASTLAAPTVCTLQNIGSSASTD
jgi:hypothetical protein